MRFSRSPQSLTPDREWLLVVDDDLPIRTLVAESFRDDGIEVVGAESGEAALAAVAARASEPVLTLIDVLMPGMDGLTLARRLQTKISRGTLLIVSGHMTDLSWWPVELREVEFLAKPFRLADLTEALARARGRYHRPRQ